MVGPLVMLVALAGAPETDAREAFTIGREHFAAGRYTEALPHLERAYQLSNKRPSTIRALAQCHRAMSQFDEAIAYFQEYLATGPSAQDREAVEKTIALLEEKRAATAKPEPPPPSAPDPFDMAGRRSDPPPPPVAPPPPLPPPAEDPASNTWIWVAAGVAVVGAAIAVGVVAASGSEEPLGGSLGMTLSL